MKNQRSLLNIITLVSLNLCLNANVIQLTEANIEKTISNSSKPVIIKWFGVWCGPCKKFGPVFNKFASQNNDKYTFAEADVDKLQNYSSKYQVMSLPTITIFKNKSIIGRIVGSFSQDALQTKINDIVNKK